MRFEFQGYIFDNDPIHAGSTFSDITNLAERRLADLILRKNPDAIVIPQPFLIELNGERARPDFAVINPHQPCPRVIFIEATTVSSSLLTTTEELPPQQQQMRMHKEKQLRVMENGTQPSVVLWKEHLDRIGNKNNIDFDPITPSRRHE